MRHAEPERIETGTGVPAEPAAHRARAASRRNGSAPGWRTSRSTPSCRARSARALETAAPVARRARPRRRDRRRARRVRRAGRPLHPDGGAARDEGRTLARDGRGPVGASSAAKIPTCSAAGSAPTIDAHRRRAPGRAVVGGLPRRRDQRRARRACSGSTQPLWFDPAYTSISRVSRVAHRRAFGRRRSTRPRTSYATGGLSTDA